MKRFVHIAAGLLIELAPVLADPLKLPSASSSFLCSDGSGNVLGMTAPTFFGSDVRLSGQRFSNRLNVATDCGAKMDGANDDSAALNTCVNLANSLRSAGRFVPIYLPPGVLYLKSPPPAFVGPGAVVGEGPQRSFIKLDQTFAGDVFRWSDTANWLFTMYAPSNYSIGLGPNPGSTGTTVTTGIANSRSGPAAIGFAIVGDLRATKMQNGLGLYDRNDFALIQDVDAYYLPGTFIKTGATLNNPTSFGAYLRESRVERVRAWSSGNPTAPVIALDTIGPGDQTNEIKLNNVDIYAPRGVALSIINNSTTESGPVRQIYINQLRIEGQEGNPYNWTTPLMQIGGGAAKGGVGNITCNQCQLTSPHTGSYALQITPPAGGGSATPSNILFNGIINKGGGGGGGVNIAGGQQITLNLTGLTSTGTNVAVASSATVAGPIVINGFGKAPSWTYSIDPTSAGFLQIPIWRSGVPSATGPTSGTTSIAGALSADALSGTTVNAGSLVLGSGGISTLGGSVTGVTFSPPGSFTGAVGTNPITGTVVPTLYVCTAAPASNQDTNIKACNVAPLGGTLATVFPTRMDYAQIVGTAAVTGAGCTVGNVLTQQGGTLFGDSSATKLNVTAIDGNGKPTAFSINNFGSYSSLPPVDASSFTGGTCTISPTVRIAYFISAYGFTGGSGYQSNAYVSSLIFNDSGIYTQSVGRAPVNNQTQVIAANGKALFDLSGTTLGVSGVSGGPVITAGALIDKSGVRQALTGLTYSVPANTSLVRFTQTSVITNQTVILPTAYADGQPVQFVNYNGSIMALNFSPAVNGWSNGSTLAANTGLRIRWDATAAAWFREH